MAMDSCELPMSGTIVLPSNKRPSNSSPSNNSHSNSSPSNSSPSNSSPSNSSPSNNSPSNLICSSVLVEARRPVLCSCTLMAYLDMCGTCTHFSHNG